MMVLMFFKSILFSNSYYIFSALLEKLSYNYVCPSVHSPVCAIRKTDFLAFNQKTKKAAQKIFDVIKMRDKEIRKPLNKRWIIHHFMTSHADFLSDFLRLSSIKPDL